MPNPMTTNPGGIIEVDEMSEFSGGKSPYGGDPYFRGPLMNPLPQPNIKSRIYVNNHQTSPTNQTHPTQSIQPTRINYILYLALAITISLGILVLLMRK